jgi:hypothetical protein
LRIIEDSKLLEKAGRHGAAEMVPTLSRTLPNGPGLPDHVRWVSGRTRTDNYHLSRAYALYPNFKPRMAKVFADAGSVIRAGRKASKRSNRKDVPQPRTCSRCGRGNYELVMKL